MGQAIRDSDLRQDRLQFSAVWTELDTGWMNKKTLTEEIRLSD